MSLPSVRGETSWALTVTCSTRIIKPTRTASFDKLHSWLLFITNSLLYGTEQWESVVSGEQKQRKFTTVDKHVKLKARHPGQPPHRRSLLTSALAQAGRP